MEISFAKIELEKLYLRGKSSKYKIDNRILKKFFLKMKVITSAQDIMDLRIPPSNHFEKLSGNNRYSIRVNMQYRLEFEIVICEDNNKLNRVIIIELSNHYK